MCGGERAPRGTFTQAGVRGEVREAAGGRAGGVSQAQGLLDEGQENEQGKGREKRKGEGSGRASRCGPLPRLAHRVQGPL